MHHRLWLLDMVQVRLGEQEALDTVAQWFETRAANELKKLMYYQERRLRSLGLVDDGGFIVMVLGGVGGTPNRQQWV